MPLTDEQLKDLDRMSELVLVIPDGRNSKEFINLCIKNSKWIVDCDPETDAAIKAAHAKYKPKE